MLPSALLSTDDLAALTGKIRPGAQRRALDRMGIGYYTRPDGRPVVTRAALDLKEQERKDMSISPNWGALGDRNPKIQP